VCICVVVRVREIRYLRCASDLGCTTDFMRVFSSRLACVCVTETEIVCVCVCVACV